MSKIKKDTLHVQGIDVGIYTEDYRNEYISLTDIARYRNSDDPRFAIQNWMRNRNTLEFLGLWESLHNPSFNRVQFDTFKSTETSFELNLAMFKLRHSVRRENDEELKLLKEEVERLRNLLEGSGEA